ncbi:MAG: lysophospholipid acyltransferase family protein [Nevskia sp.]|nr:lysophospholipid acyltransferase family protein [Nevskia sp.]
MISRVLRTLGGVHAMAMFVIVLLLLFCPLLLAAPSLRLRRAIGRLGVRAWLAASFIPFRIRGLERLPPGPCIAVCNHASYLDGILVTAALPARFTFLVQHRAADWPYIGPIIKRMGVTFVNRGSVRGAAQATLELIGRIQQGESFAIFPEGTFRAPAMLLPFHSGAFMVAARAEVPVAPLALRGSRDLLGEGQRLFRWSPLTLQVLDPLQADGADRDAVQNLRDAARAAILQHCGEADGLHQPIPAWRG